MERPSGIHFEPLESRFLLSADSIVPGLIASFEDGLAGNEVDDGFADALQQLVDIGGDDSFGMFVPGLRLDSPNGDTLAPTVRELLQIDTDVNETPGTSTSSDIIDFINAITDSEHQIAGDHDIDQIAKAIIDVDLGSGLVLDAEAALSLVDQNDDGFASTTEMFEVVVVGQISEFLEQFPSAKEIVDPNDSDLFVFVTPSFSNLFGGFTHVGGGPNNGVVVQGLEDFLDNLAVPALLADFADLTFGYTDISNGDVFSFKFDVKMSVKDDYHIDLGLTVESLEINLPEEFFTNVAETGGDSTAFSQVPEVEVKGTLSLPLTFSIARDGSADFSFALTDDAQFSIDVDQSLVGYNINVGFLGLVGGAGSVFDLDIPLDVELIDPSSPVHLGFEQIESNELVFGVHGDGQIEGTDRVLEATLALDGLSTSLDQDVIFSLAFGNHELPPVEVTVIADDNSDADVNIARLNLVDDINAALITAGIGGIVEAGLNVDKIKLTLFDGNATRLGFTDQENYSATGDLVADNVIFAGLNFSADFAFDAAILLSFGALPPSLITASVIVLGADETARKADLKNKLATALQSAVDSAFGGGNVDAGVNGDDKVFFEDLGTVDPLEIIRAIAMSAEYDITSSELANASFDEILKVTPDTQNDNFEILFNLDVKSGIVVTNGDLDDESLEITADLLVDNGGTVEFTLQSDLGIDFTDLERLDLGGSLVLSGEPFSSFDPSESSHTFQTLLDFNVIGANEVVNLLGQLKGWLDRLPNAEVLAGYDIPFADAALGDILDFAKMLEAELLLNDNGDGFQSPDDPEFNDLGRLITKINTLDETILSATFATAQELATRLNKPIFSGDTLTGVANYDVGNQLLTYDIKVSAEGDSFTAPIDFELDLAPISEVSVVADVFISPTVTFEATVGFDLRASKVIALTTDLGTLNNDDGVPIKTDLAVTSAETIKQVFGRLSADAEFSLSVDGGGFVAVTVAKSATDDNLTTDDLLVDINASLSTAGLGSNIEAVEIADHVVLQAKAGVSSFAISVSNTDVAATQLGLQSSVASTVFLTGTAIGSMPPGFGAFEIQLNDTGTVHTIRFDAVGANTVNDLVEDINVELAANVELAGKIVAGRAGNSLVLAAIDASVDVFKVFDFSGDFTETNALGLGSGQLNDEQIGGTFFSSVAGVFLVGEDFLDPDVNNDANAASGFGRLVNNASFTVDLGGGVFDTITVTALATEENTKLADLIDQINDEIGASAPLAGKILAVQVNAGQMALRVISAEVISIDITSSAVELGLLSTLDSADGPLRVAATRDAPSYFGPSADATFTITYSDGDGGGTRDVTVSAGDAVTNRLFFDLVSGVNQALNNAFGGSSNNPFVAEFDGQRLVIVAKDGFGITAFDISSLDGNTAETELFLRDSVLDGGGTQTVDADSADLLVHTQDGAVHRVTLDGAAIIQDVLDAISGDTGGDVTGALNAAKTGINLTDHTAAAVPDPFLFRVESVNGSRAVFALGLQAADNNLLVATVDLPLSLDSAKIDHVIEGDAVSTLDLEDRLFIHQVDGTTPVLSAEFVLSVLVENVSAQFGFVGVDLSSLGFDPNLPISETMKFEVALTTNKLGDPEEKVTLAELFDAISLDVNGDGVFDIHDLNEVMTFPTLEVIHAPTPSVSNFDDLVFDVALQAGADFVSLGALPQLTLHMHDAGNLFNQLPGTDEFDATDTSIVDIAGDSFNLIGHGFESGDRVTYRDGDGTSIEGLADNQDYFVIKLDNDTIQLAETKPDALLNIPVAVTLTGLGTTTTGPTTGHRLLAGFAPIQPDIDVHISDLDDLANFADVDFETVLAALSQLRDFLNEFAEQDFLGAEIPVLGLSFNDLMDISGSFSEAVDDITNNQPATVQQLEQKLRESFGLPPGAGIISLELVDDMDVEAVADSKDMLKVTLDLSRSFTEVLEIDLDLSQSVVPFGELSLLGRAGMGAAIDIDAKLSVGVDLDDDDGDLNDSTDNFGEVFLFTDADTHINLSLKATSTDITFNASLGPLGVAIIGGDGQFDLGFEFGNGGAAPGDRVSISDFAGISAAFGGFDAELSTTTLLLNLPVFFPSPSDFVGDIAFAAELAIGGDGLTFAASPSLTLPTDLLNPDFFTNFGILNSLPLAIDGLDLLLETLQNLLTGDVFGLPLPLIGDTLADGAEFIEDMRQDLIDPLRNLVENTPKTDEDLAELVKQFLFVVLGPGGSGIGGLLPELQSLSGLGLLLDAGGNVADAADFADLANIIDLAIDLENSFAIWNFELGDSYTPDIDFGFDFGFPGLGLAMEGGLAVELAWELGLGFGISTEDGPFIDVSRDEELSISIEAGFQPGSELVGSLGFLQFSAAAGTLDDDHNNITDNNHVTADFSVNLINGQNANDEHISFFELGDLDAIIDFNAAAELNLALELAFDKDLLPDVISAILPAVQADFVFEWDLSSPNILDNGFNFDIAGGLKVVAFNNVGLDLGSFLGDFLGPIVSQIQEITEPLQPIIEIVTAPIPVLSDLAGKDISLVDIAASFGEFDPGLIFALADLITFVNSIPSDPGSIMLPLGDFVVFGSGILSPENLADSTFSFADALNPDSSAFSGAIAGIFDELDPLAGLFNDAGEFVQGVFDSALGGDAGSAEAASVGGLFSGDFNSQDRGGFDFPFLKDPKQIFGMLLGNPMVLVTYDLPPLIVEFTWEQSFMIYGPLFGVVGAGLGVKIDLAFGYDTLGVQQFAEGGFENPLDLLAGLFISDTNNPDGSGTDVPELQLIGELSVGAELNAGVASAGIQAAIRLIVDFDLNDPDGDGRVRISELLGNFLYELNYGSPALAPIAIFDVSGEIAFQLRAYLKILFAKFTFNITPQITLFEFSIPFDREPFLATERGDGTLLLNIGPNAGSRLHGNTDDIAETINVFQVGDDIFVWSDQFNVSISAAQKYSADKGISGFGGEFDDIINIDSSVTLAVELEGNTGNDIITALGSGGGTITGNQGDDILTGGDGEDTITGGEGNDVIDGGGGADLIFGDTGRISDRLISVLIRDKDGDDIITGGAGNDTIFGGGGSDTIGGDGPLVDLQGFPTITDDLLDPVGGGNDTIFGDGGRIIFERDGVPLATPEIRSTNSPDGKKDFLFGQGGVDVIFGGAGDDIIDGGADNDELHGESGFDVISGAGGSDTIFGGTEADILYGFRIGTESHGDAPGTDGLDVIDGGAGNDFIRGNQDNDTIFAGRGTDIVFGDEGNDTIFGGSDNDFIFGGADNDTVEGGTGNDIVFGDDGLVVFFNFGSLSFASSFVSPGPGHVIDGNHRLIGDVALSALDPMTLDNDDNFRTLDLILTAVAPTDGNDFVIGGEGDDIVIGGAGNDTIFGDFDPDQILGKLALGLSVPPIPADEDILIGDAGRIEFKNRLRELITTVVGNIAGNDTISGNGGEDVVLGGGGSDILFGRMDPVFTQVTLEEDAGVSDDDIIIGDDGRVAYVAGVLDEISTTRFPASPDPADTGGNDFANGNKGNDIILGGFGNDELTGATGEDIIIGDQGVVDYGFFNGGQESAIIRIFSNDPDNSFGGSDTIRGNEDNDVIIGGADGDTITGDQGQDIVLGDAGEVIYDDGIGSDIFRPNLDFVRTKDFHVGGDDTISGGGDKDIVIGGSFADTIRGDNDLANETVANADDDILIGDQGEVEFNDSVDDPNSDLPAMVRIETIDITNADGGIDIIDGNEGIDLILGGVEGDILHGNTGNDIILGDEGILRFDGTDTGAPASTNGLAAPLFDNNLLSLDLIASKEFTLGGNDFIFGNQGDDIAMGGTGQDVMIGDNEQSAPGVYGLHEADSGQDILIGDQGRVTLFDAVDESGIDVFSNNISRVESTDAAETDGDGDYIEGNDKADIIIGGVNNGNIDTLLGEADIPAYVVDAGDDIILGDEGFLRFDILPNENIIGAGDESAGLAILETLDQVITFKTGAVSNGSTHLGGAEVIFGNGGSDIVMGGTDGDTIFGDLYGNNEGIEGGGLLDSDDPGSDVLLGDGGEMRFADFEIFNGSVNAEHVTILQTVETGQGGADIIEGNELGDVIMGGFGGDTLFGESDDHLALMVTLGGGIPEAGDDVILGDNGEMNWVLASDDILGRPDVLDHLSGTTVQLDAGRATLDRITTIDPTLGGQDRIEGNGGNDTILGGTESDLIWGDTPDADPIAALADGDAGVDGADGADLIFGDHGKLYPTLPAADSFFLNNNFFSIDTQDADLGRGDIMFGGANDDIMIGGQGDDIMFGEQDDDDMIGGHNVAGGEDDLDAMDNASKLGLSTEVVANVGLAQILADLNPAVNKEFNDIMDGGIDDDVMAGDNAVIIHRSDDLSIRFRSVGADGQLFSVTSEVLGGLIYADTGFTANVSDGFQQHQDMTLARTVYLLDHDQANEQDALENNTDGDGANDARRFGNDIMVGGLNDDEIFGQLGDDIIQGDGELLVIDPAKVSLDPYDPAQNADPSFDIRSQIIDVQSVTLRFDVFENSADGNDYIEGNGGNDRIYGGLGQDDIIGGSSTLFTFIPDGGGLPDHTTRPDGADLIYGGAGNFNVLERNAEFGGVENDITGDTIVPDSQRHAFDADTILGDNGDIFQIVTVDGPTAPAQYAYDESGRSVDDGYSADLSIRVRAVNLVDYGYSYVDNGGTREDLTFLATARGAGDLIYGETGDDVIHGMTGNDVIFGNSGDDDLHGEIGSDFLLGGTGRDGIVGDDGLILTSRNDLVAETLYGVAALNPDQGVVKRNEEVDIFALNAVITTPGDIQRAVINVENQLQKDVELFAFRTDDVEGVSFAPLFGEALRFNDIVFGGLGQDFLHAGDGDDAVSGAEALPAYYSGTGFGFSVINDFLIAQQNAPSALDPAVADAPFWFDIAPSNPGDVLRFEGEIPQEFALYDEFFPRRKIVFDFDLFSGFGDVVVLEAIDGFGGTTLDFLLNFAEEEGPDGFPFFDDGSIAKPTDGDDRMFGDLGNDWIVGGTGRDHMWGGRGNDMLNMDDDHDSGAGGTHPNRPPGDALDNTQSDEFQAYSDIAYGGAGRDVMILNTGADRAIDWVGEYNSYIVPFSPFGAFHISRAIFPQMPEFLYALSDSDGADVRANTPDVPDPGVLPSAPDAELYVDQKNADVRTDDPDPTRNDEPFGELGLVLQKDRDWQAQTGAPDDPQPGNLQGQREIMRRELFNDGSAPGPGGNPNALTAFAADTGDWEVSSGVYSASPDALSEEAISVYHLDQMLPSYVEILVTVNAEKATTSISSNGFVIFDYQSANDFKFAGIDIQSKKFIIGHRTGEIDSKNIEKDWVIDASHTLPLRPGKDYNLTVTLHGLVATIYVNQSNPLSFAFDDALNDGLLGLASLNSKTAFDDWQVQKLPPVITFEQLDDFASTSSNYTPQSGTWELSGGEYVGTAGSGQTAVSAQALSVQPFSRIWLEASVQTDGQGGLVFDYYDAETFKFVALNADTDELVIGHMSKTGLVVDASTVFDVKTNKSYQLGISIQGTSVSVSVDGADELGHGFFSLINDGKVGLLSHDGSTTSFDDALLQTDDPAYIEAAGVESLVAEASTLTNGDGAAAITYDMVGAVLGEAAQRWTASGLLRDDQVAGFEGGYMIADLEGAALAQLTSGGMLLVDTDAAGLGWFVDSTPGDDAEFQRPLGSNALAATPASEAFGRIDLLTTVMHEMGHGLGFDHTNSIQPDLMSAELSTGIRLQPTDAVEAGDSLVAASLESVESNGRFVPDEAPSSIAGHEDIEVLVFEPSTGEFINLLDEDEEKVDGDVEFVDLLTAADDDDPSHEDGILQTDLGSPIETSLSSALL